MAPAAKAKTSRKLPGHYCGIEDVKDHLAIHEAKAKGDAVLDWARRHRGNGVEIVNERPGRNGATLFDLRIPEGPVGLRRKQEWLEMQGPARRLAEARSDKVKARREQDRIAVRGRHGRRVKIHAINERLMAHRGLIRTAARVFGSPMVLPRCQQVEPEKHDYRKASDGLRCWYCGRKAVRDG